MVRALLVKPLVGLLVLHNALATPVKRHVSIYREPDLSSCAPHEPRLGAVASSSEICSHIGTSLLKAGGNAADALVGTVACIGVVAMYHSGESIYSFIHDGYTNK
jgi:gamma-glutamyltranspeptidase/glutathione hydrolase